MIRSCRRPLSSALLLLLAASSTLPLTDAALSVTSTLTSVGLVGISILTGLVVKHNKLAPVYTPEPGSLQGQTILITGGNTGLGLESAKRLAAAGAHVVITVRSDAKGQKAVQAIRDYVKEYTATDENNAAAEVSYKILQLDDLESIKSSVASWLNDDDNNNTFPRHKIDVLMNNAGFWSGPNRELTVDGMEASFQTNHLGHFLLTALLQDRLAWNARVINVSSSAKDYIQVLDLEYAWEPTESDFGFFQSYAQSKLANILFSQELQRRSAASGSQWVVSSCHPGAVASDFGRNFFHWKLDMDAIRQGSGAGGGFWPTLLVKLVQAVMRTTAQGASTQVWLAVHDKDVNGVDVRGTYLVDRKVAKLADYAKDAAAAERLWKESEERAGIRFEFELSDEEGGQVVDEEEEEQRGDDEDTVYGDGEENEDGVDEQDEEEDGNQNGDQDDEEDGDQDEEVDFEDGDHEAFDDENDEAATEEG
jgi:NAD(P)-dependent dehydrogenase (short-subunit alcohol dehydrogenase family)